MSLIHGTFCHDSFIGQVCTNNSIDRIAIFFNNMLYYGNVKRLVLFMLNHPEYLNFFHRAMPRIAFGHIHEFIRKYNKTITKQPALRSPESVIIENAAALWKPDLGKDPIVVFTVLQYWFYTCMIHDINKVVDLWFRYSEDLRCPPSLEITATMLERRRYYHPVPMTPALLGIETKPNVITYTLITMINDGFLRPRSKKRSKIVRYLNILSRLPDQLVRYLTNTSDLSSAQYSYSLYEVFWFYFGHHDIILVRGN